MPDTQQSQDRQKPTRVTIAFHYGAIVLGIISFVSGYVAFDINWSGVGWLNRPVYFAAHQTSGILLLLLGFFGLYRLIWRGFGAPLLKAPLDWIAGTYHRLLLLAFVIASASAIFGTGCGGYPFHIFGWLRLPLELPGSICMVPMHIFEFHKDISNWLLVGIGLHVVAAAAHHLIIQDSRLNDMFNPRPLKSDK